MNSLEQDLLQLFDLRKTKVKKERILNLEVAEAKKDIRLLIRMFSDGIPDISIALNEGEKLIWDSGIKRILYSKKDITQFIEAAEKKTIVRVRPHLKTLVKLAKDKIEE